MSKRSSRWFKVGGDDDDALDALLTETWEAGTAAIAGVLDLSGGKAALAAGIRSRQPAALGASPGGVQEQIDTLLAQVAAQIGTFPGPAHSAVAANLNASRHFLIQLRAGLASRNLARDAALQLTSSVSHALTEADRTLRHLPSGPGGPDSPENRDLAELLAGIRHQLPALSRRIEWLFDEADDLARVPVPSR
jgi:hypothetical protein